MSLTPVASGLWRPGVAVVLLAAAVIGLSHLSSLAHHHEGWLALILVGPPALVLATRTWRWRSQKVFVTTERVVVVGGVLDRVRRSVDLGDVVTVNVAQRVRDRVTRRGDVWLDTPAGAVDLGRVRHAAALVRVVERQRSSTPERLPLDTVFDFREPERGLFGPDLQWPGGS